MDIQDAHTHFFSQTFFRTLAAGAPDGPVADADLARLLRDRGLELPSAQVAAHTRRWLDAMDVAGVGRMVTFASVPEELEVVAEAARLAAGRLVPFLMVNPAAPAAPGLVSRALGELGYRGVLTFPAMHRFQVGDPALDPVWQLANDHRAFVLVHCGVLKIKLRDLLGYPNVHDLALANPLAVIPAAGRFPHARFVLPHFGGGFFREALLAGAQCANVFVDTSSSNDWMRTQGHPLDLQGVFRATLAVFGPERVLFGSDSSVFPRGYRGDLAMAQIAALDRAGVGTEDQHRIMGGNLARLLD